MEDYLRLTWAHMPRLAPAVVARLEALRAGGWKLAVVTNGEATAQASTVEKIGLTPLLDACVVSGAVGLRKPDPRIVELAAAECGVSLDGAWLIGDGEADIGAAAAAGITSVWLSAGREWASAAVTPDHTAPSLLDALALVA
ncbi:Pyrimidine 5'-nucleotidase YjjG [Baekduia alba]|nr:Pyrimidine 5'-nucleotidase YjjG [Baekduia alba]